MEDKSGGLRRRALIGGAVAAGAAGVLAGVAIAGVGTQGEKSPEKAFNPLEGETVRLAQGRGLKSEVIGRFPGEVDIDVAVRKLVKAAGTQGDYVNVDYFLTKEAPSKWVGDYVGVEEGGRVSENYKVNKVDPENKKTTLEVTANGKVDTLIVDPGFTFKDEKGNTRTIVATLGRVREEVKGGVAPQTVQIPDRVVVHIAPKAA